MLISLFARNQFMRVLPVLSICALFLLLHHANAQIEDSAECECVAHYLCYSNGTINTNGEHLIDIRFRPDDCPSYLDICCKKEQLQIKATILQTSNQLKQEPCGVRNPDGVGFRLSGNVDNEAQFGEFPWMVAVLHQPYPAHNFTYKCGGSLIHPQVVLSAAHCADVKGKYKVRVGEWDSQTTKEIFKHQDLNVEEVVLHPNYDLVKTPYVNDVSLLYLESEVLLAPHVNLVCLPPQNYVASGSECFVNGWGKDKFEKDGMYQTILKKVQVPVVNRRSCEKAVSTILETKFALHKSFMCAGGEKGKDACTGDGGGPLVCRIKGKEQERYQQVGIVAWGVACGLEGVPGGYVDVAAFKNWIDFNLLLWNLNNTIYNY